MKSFFAVSLLDRSLRVGLFIEELFVCARKKDIVKIVYVVLTEKK